MLVQDHGYGGNWTSFGSGGALHQLAVRYDALPKWILFGLRYGGTIPWPGYRTRSDPTPWVERPTPPELGDTEYRGGGRVLFSRVRR